MPLSGDNVVVRKGAKLDGCIVANNAQIGQNSIIMPGSVIPDSANISNDEKISADIKLNAGDIYETKAAAKA